MRNTDITDYDLIHFLSGNDKSFEAVGEEDFKAVYKALHDEDAPDQVVKDYNKKVADDEEEDSSYYNASYN